MELKALLKNPNEWQFKNGYYEKAETEILETAFSKELQNDFNDAFADSWWERCNANVVISLFNKYRQTDRQTDRQNCYIADIGGSNGDIAKMMTDEGFNMILIEPTKEACVNASKKGISNIICGYVNDNDFNPKCFDDCLLSNVLEHIEKDIDFLKCLKDKMKENAKIIILVPAFQFLWNSNDNVAKHFRRYSLKRLNKAAVEAGFKVLFSSYFFSFLFLPMLAIKILERFGFIKKYDVNNETYKNRHTGGFLTNFIIKIFNKIEIKFMRLKIKIPFGTSIALVARK